jgi:hypothetical protein
MFSGCTGLVDAPVLRAIKLVNNCYYGMFSGCVNLENAPGSDRYTDYTPVQNNMFTDCEELVYPLRYCEIPTGFGGLGDCPGDYSLLIKGSTSVTPRWTTDGDPLEYCLGDLLRARLGDDVWLSATSGSRIITGEPIRFRGSNRDSLFTRFDSSNAWTIEGSDVVISGNFNALLDYTTFPLSVGEYAFCYMLYHCDSIKRVNAILPATTVNYYSYYEMFGTCLNLIKAPNLPATKLNTYCYANMFQNCISLVNAPNLPSNELAFLCYSSMFANCVSLVNTPRSDIYTTLKPEQNNMFIGCTSIKEPLRYCEIPVAWGGLGGCPDPDYFTIIGSSSVKPMWTSNPNAPPLQYKLGDTLQDQLDDNLRDQSDDEWIDVMRGEIIVTNDVIKFRGTERNALFSSENAINTWVINGENVILSGNMNTLLDYLNPPLTITDYAFNSMFRNVNSLVSASNIILPATTVGNRSYCSMFNNCINLVNVPSILPATTLAEYCYREMFNECNNIVNPPTLPATTLAPNCYYNMFYKCTALTSAPALNATILEPYCYQGMFNGCTSLVNAPVLPAMVLAHGCYQYMFNGCTSLVNAPALNATTLAQQCYDHMFYDCIGLVNAPALNATTLAEYCYQYMFYGCTSLVNAPDLPATTLSNSCYSFMFANCNHLETALNSNNYTQLTPTQDAMFNSCNALEDPLPYCAIPTTWGGGGTCLSLILTGTSSVTPKWSTDGDPLEYQLGTADWCDAVSGDSIETNDVIRFRGTGRTSLFNSNDESNAWVVEGTDVVVNGNFNCLLDYTDKSLIIGEYAFSYLLYNNENITTVNAKLTSTVLAERCYYSMFRGCTGLTIAPVLPATELVKYCYYYMFYGCTNLTEAPGADKYTKYEPEQGGMFSLCKNLSSPIKYTKILDGWK